jgi:hypothetical protein
MNIIQDGTGSGLLAKVDSDNRLRTRSVTRNIQAQRSFEGYGYNLNTGNIALTSGSESAIMYLKYTGNENFHISALAVGVGSMGGTVSDPTLIKLIKNPTSGTLISDKTAVDDNENRNFGSPNTLSADVYKGGEAKTVSGGQEVARFFQNGNGRLFATIDFIIPPQNSVAVTFTPNATTAGNIYAALIGFEET